MSLLRNGGANRGGGGATLSAPIIGALDDDIGWVLDEVTFDDSSTMPMMASSSLSSNKPDLSRSKSYSISKQHPTGEETAEGNDWFDVTTAPAAFSSVAVTPELARPSRDDRSRSQPVSFHSLPKPQRSRISSLNRAKSESNVEDNRKLAASQASSSINDAARIKSWEEVCKRCRTVPLDAAYRDSDGWTALHHAASRRPPTYPIEALVEAHPDAIFCAERLKGFTPLHYACRFKATLDVVKCLLKAARMAESESMVQNMTPRDKMRCLCSMTCKKGRTPLYYALRYDAPDGVMELLIKHYPLGGIHQDRNGLSPLRYVWDKDRKNLGKFQEAVDVYCHPKIKASAPQSQEHIIQKLLHHQIKSVGNFAKTYVTALKLICAAHFVLRRLDNDENSSATTNDELFNSEELPVNNVLHALSNVGACHVPPLVWEITTKIFSTQSSEPDCDGNLPLHYGLKVCSACACLEREVQAEIETHSLISSDSQLFNSDVTAGSDVTAAPTKMDDFTCHDFVIDLLSLHKEGATKRSFDQVLPLHLALRSNKTSETQAKADKCRWQRFTWARQGNKAENELPSTLSEDPTDWTCPFIKESTMLHHVSTGTGVVGLLVRHHPHALGEAETCSNLLPFMIPGACEPQRNNGNLKDDKDYDLTDLQNATLTFDLLLESPGLLSHFLS